MANPQVQAAAPYAELEGMLSHRGLMQPIQIHGSDPAAVSYTHLDVYKRQDLSFLGLLTFIGVSAALVQILEMTLDKYVPSLYNALGVFLSLIHI